jgi:hypothetical protein
LLPSHAPFPFRGIVIIPEEVEHGVGCEKGDLPAYRVTKAGGLFDRSVQAEEDVAEKQGRSRTVVRW